MDEVDVTREHGKRNDDRLSSLIRPPKVRRQLPRMGLWLHCSAASHRTDDKQRLVA
jgi:hypothetical protein